ncbi:glyoxylase-like metal-dependent hydrolase (beta-lactamase superfamily II) [Nakamurella sp. UYEF19]|uniref:MBL fold metallo-hydrolase n=1 Tax=Nakamurella sp. UYEF19 TaxID=1756392 RepID=UPI00339AFCE6
MISNDGTGAPWLQAGTVRGVAAGVSVLLADNPGPMTLDGTNSYLLAGPDHPGLVVVDPGPDDNPHLQELAEQGRVELILVTHRHLDHTAGSARLAAVTGAPVRAADPGCCHGGGKPLVDGELIDVAGRTLRVLATPGHTDDSVSFHLLESDGHGAVLTGDTILGRGTTVIAHPDGDLASYLSSLDRLAALGPALVLPAHGPELPDLAATCAQYAEHREERLDSVRAALLVLGREATVVQVTDLVYTDIAPHVRPAAELSVAAQLHYLRGQE